MKNKRNSKGEACPRGYKWVYARFIRKNGKIIYPRNARFFKFLVKE